MTRFEYLFQKLSNSEIAALINYFYNTTYKCNDNLLRLHWFCDFTKDNFNLFLNNEIMYIKFGSRSFDSKREEVYIYYILTKLITI